MDDKRFGRFKAEFRHAFLHMGREGIELYSFAEQRNVSVADSKRAYLEVLEELIEESEKAGVSLAGFARATRGESAKAEPAASAK